MTDLPIDPPPPPETHPALRRARGISRVMDELVRLPGTRIRVGLDPVLGLVPGLGDWVPLAISLDLWVTAARLGAGPAVLLRMLGHIAIDAIVGTVPLLGDLFDLGWKANQRNLAILEALVATPERTRRRSRWVIGGVIGTALGLVAGGMWIGWRVLAAVIGWL
jgi:hypothetical protein